MIFSKGTFYLEKISGDAAEFVTVDRNGNSFAANDKCWAALSPVPEEVRKAVPLTESNWPEEGIGISPGTCKEMVKSLPKDTTFGGLLENSAIELKTKGDIALSMTDGRRKRAIFASAITKAKVPFKWLANALLSREEPGSVSIALNRKRLMALLEVMDKTCPDPGKAAPLWLTLTKKGRLVLRGVNPKTDQRFIGMMKEFEDSEWIQDSEWEKSLTQPGPVAGEKKRKKWLARKVEPAKKRGCARRKK